MYNKIAPIILNSGKTPGASTVYISQPDSNKEKLAGKTFLLAEIGGRKNEAEKIIKFLITELESNYYDDKLLLIGKIDGLKVDNIFEATIGKINHNLEEFLSEHKIKLNTSATSITIGAIFENKLHFCSYGKNRSLLIYRRQDGYEIINVENQANNLGDKDIEKNKEQTVKKPVLFSSVINGEVPLSSYFIFASESLPEYLSGREMVEIITKLPPIVAAEQMRTVLSKINSYVPFLGIIIKNTTDSSGQEIKEALEIPASAQNSISSLNYTEQKTENMLAPAGIISLDKIGKGFKRLFKKIKPKKVLSKRQQMLREMEHEPVTKRVVAVAPQEKTGLTNIFSMPEGNTFLKPTKIYAKKSSHYVLIGFRSLFSFLSAIIKPSAWIEAFKNSKQWLKNLNKKNLFLLSGFVLVVIILVVSLKVTDIRKTKEKNAENYKLLVSEIENKEVLIDSNLLYDNTEGATRILADAKSLVDALPREEDFQIETYEDLNTKIKNLEDKTKKINRVTNLNEIKSVANLNITELIVANKELYASALNSVYKVDLNDGEHELISSNEDGIDLRGAKFDGKDTIYFRHQSKVYRLNTETKKFNSTALGNYNEADNYAGFSLFNQKMYLLSRSQNQVFVYPSNLSTRANWLKDVANLDNSIDLYIDGNIYILNNDGQVIKYRIGKLETYNSRPLDPITKSADKILGDDKQLYILDADNKRLVIIAKDDGHLMGQYYFENLSTINDFALDNEARLIYILADDKIFSWSL